jgi:hypothetical protein
MTISWCSRLRKLFASGVMNFTFKPQMLLHTEDVEENNNTIPKGDNYYGYEMVQRKCMGCRRDNNA